MDPKGAEQFHPGTKVLLTHFTANPATPTKTSHRKGSAKTLYDALFER